MLWFVGVDQYWLIMYTGGERENLTLVLLNLSLGGRGTVSEGHFMEF